MTLYNTLLDDHDNSELRDIEKANEIRRDAKRSHSVKKMKKVSKTNKLKEKKKVKKSKAKHYHKSIH